MDGSNRLPFSEGYCTHFSAQLFTRKPLIVARYDGYMRGKDSQSQLTQMNSFLDSFSIMEYNLRFLFVK